MADNIENSFFVLVNISQNSSRSVFALIGDVGWNKINLPCRALINPFFFAISSTAWIITDSKVILSPDRFASLTTGLIAPEYFSITISIIFLSLLEQTISTFDKPIELSVFFVVTTCSYRLSENLVLQLFLKYLFFSFQKIWETKT